MTVGSNSFWSEPLFCHFYPVICHFYIELESRDFSERCGGTDPPPSCWEPWALEERVRVTAGSSGGINTCSNSRFCSDPELFTSERRAQSLSDLPVWSNPKWQVWNRPRTTVWTKEPDHGPMKRGEPWFGSCPVWQLAACCCSLTYC